MKTENKINTKSINNRIDEIKTLISHTKIKPLVDYNNYENFTTEYFENKTAAIINNQITDKIEYNFYDFIKNLNGKLEYIQSGAYGHTFKGISIKNNQTIEYAIKVVPYQKKAYGKITDERRPENAEIKMFKLLSYFIVNKHTSHIVLPIFTFYTDITYFINLSHDLSKTTKQYDEFIENYNKNRFYDKVSILISEWANGGDLLDYIRNNYQTLDVLHWKIIFFQILSVLAIIQSKYPAFRHNDLKANNILLQKIQKNNKKYLYDVCNQTFTIPNLGFQIKINDFDFACIDNIVDNSKVNSHWAQNYFISAKQNRYYDIHFFFNTLIHCKSDFMDKIPNEVKTFINSVVPLKYQTYNTEFVLEKGRLKINDEYLIPYDILCNNPFFSSLKFNKPSVIPSLKHNDNINSNIIVSTNNTNNISTKSKHFDIMNLYSTHNNDKINKELITIVKSHTSPSLKIQHHDIASHKQYLLDL